MLKELIDAGFTPVNALLVVALGVLGKVILALHQKGEQSREEWHTETRKRIDDMQGHITECDEDRSKLREEMGQLKERVERVGKCPKSDCPIRLP